jgi:hypothetical protein
MSDIPQQEPDPNHFLADLSLAARGNAYIAQDSFEAFRRTIRPNMLWNPFVLRLTRELQNFYEAFEAGARPKLAISTPPQHGKSIAAEDFAAWVAGKQPNWKTIYASFSEDLGVRCNLNLQRLFMSSSFRKVFPTFMVGQTFSRGLRSFWQLNSNLIEYIDHVGSFRNTTTQGKITGMELNLGILDDFVKGRAEANSKPEREDVELVHRRLSHALLIDYARTDERYPVITISAAIRDDSSLHNIACKTFGAQALSPLSMLGSVSSNPVSIRNPTRLHSTHLRSRSVRPS